MKHSVHFNSRKVHFGLDEGDTILCRRLQGKSDPVRRRIMWRSDPDDVDCPACLEGLRYIEFVAERLKEQQRL